MKLLQAKGFAFLAVAVCMTASPESSSAQDLAPGEFIVSSQIIGDSASSGIVSSSPTSDSYVGDVSYDEAGIDGGCIGRGYGQPDLFYNYYTSGMCNRANAQMYLSPLPVPPNVGHTFFTYQPFYPEEMLYWHKNRFHNYYDNGRGMNRTRATYWSPPVRQAASNLYWNYLRLPR